MELNIHFRKINNVLSVFIEGEIDTFTAPKLREKLESIVISQERLIELDLSKVTYMDSTGLGVFVALYKNVTRENGNLKLVGLTARIKRLFNITGLSELMNIEVGAKVE
ncbi:STAS domain-containing protein [Ureibacillus acetophenoni]|uniref:Anti-sigma factor antagonist n=1 Tax=Ureibacillus acetophenoni TaxID=614649 RepID=A0A285UJV2_9BACL|nr:STAS domain-containing protein [Ureibacillus acetophenoni]SOC42129.1 anti-sigma B factor antagonist [Ureibacillus acetophenoni]